jgi:hypothetical protein
MAGSNYVLDKGVPVLSTYNSSATTGVQAFRCVKITTAGLMDIQLASTAGNIAFVVQENIDAAKVATGKAIADVRFMGITKVRVGVATGVTIGSRVMPNGTDGSVITATGATAQVLGIVVGTDPSAGTVATGDLIDVLLTPGTQFGA